MCYITVLIPYHNQWIPSARSFERITQIHRECLTFRIQTLSQLTTWDGCWNCWKSLLLNSISIQPDKSTKIQHYFMQVCMQRGKDIVLPPLPRTIDGPGHGYSTSDLNRLSPWSVFGKSRCGKSCDVWVFKIISFYAHLLVFSSSWTCFNTCMCAEPVAKHRHNYPCSSSFSVVLHVIFFITLFCFRQCSSWWKGESTSSVSLIVNLFLEKALDLV